MNKFTKLISIAAAFLFLTAATKRDVRELSLSHINHVYDIFETGYAPQAWKNKQTKWSLEAAVAEAKNAIQSKKAFTVQDYHRVLENFIRSTRDYHVGVSVQSTERSYIPVIAKKFDGKYHLVAINRAQLPYSAFPANKGDELVAIDGVPTDEIAQDIIAKTGGNTKETDQALAEFYLTVRRAELGPVPKGVATLTLKKLGGKTFDVQVVWNYTKEQFDVNKPFYPASTGSLFEKEMKHPLDYEMYSPVAMNIAEIAKDARDEQLNPYYPGNRTTYLPRLGQPIWENKSEGHFDAYIYMNKNKQLIGYVRIPTYSAGVEQTKEFAAIIEKMESLTDALVIDQINNPGGSVFYLYSLVSLLSDKPMTTPHHKMVLSQSDIASAYQYHSELEKVQTDEKARETFGDDIGGYPVNFQVALLFKEYYRFLIEQWETGHTLTEPHYLGVDHIMPNPNTHYTKPILLLVNELDFSGGDFFPAIMQDNKRATIMGVRTAGAGGYVRGIETPNLLGVKMISFTGSIAVRNDSKNSPIENLGVTPDIEYVSDLKDLLSGYQNYAKAIKNQINTMAK